MTSPPARRDARSLDAEENSPAAGGEDAGGRRARPALRGAALRRGVWSSGEGAFGRGVAPCRSSGCRPDSACVLETIIPPSLSPPARPNPRAGSSAPGPRALAVCGQGPEAGVSGSTECRGPGMAVPACRREIARAWAWAGSAGFTARNNGRGPQIPAHGAPHQRGLGVSPHEDRRSRVFFMRCSACPSAPDQTVATSTATVVF